MDKNTLILVMLGLIFLLIVLIGIYVWNGRTTKKEQTTAQAVVTFEGMCTLIHSKVTSNPELNHAVDTIIGRYSHIDEFSVYGSLLEALCVHPNTDSKVILRFQKALITANPNLKEKIEKTLKLGLAGRK